MKMGTTKPFARIASTRSLHQLRGMNAPFGRLSAIIILSLFAAFTPQLSSADAQRADGELLTRYFPVAPSIIWTAEEISGKWPLILDGLEDNEMTRTNNSRKFLEACGVTFPPGASAVYYQHASLLGVKNTAENIRKVAEIMEMAGPGEQCQLFIEVRIMEYTPDVETKLADQATFADLEAKLGDSVKTVCTSSVITKSGQSAEGRLDSGIAKPNSSQKPSSKAKRAVEESESWPPPEGIQRALLEIEATLIPADVAGVEHAEMQFKFRYAAPAGSGQPAMKSEVSTNLAIRDGVILVAKTFTISDPANKHPAPRRYAVLVSFKKLNAEGKTMKQLGQEIAKKLKKPKQP